MCSCVHCRDWLLTCEFPLIISRLQHCTFAVTHIYLAREKRERSRGIHGRHCGTLFCTYSLNIAYPARWQGCLALSDVLPDHIHQYLLPTHHQDPRAQRTTIRSDLLYISIMSQSGCIDNSCKMV